MESVERFLERRLKLKVNRAKSAVARPAAAQVPRVQLHTGRDAAAAHRPAGAGPVQGTGAGDDEADARRESGKDRRGSVALSHGLARLLRLLRDTSVLRALDRWVRRRLRSIAWKQWKRGRSRYRGVASQGRGPRIWRRKPPAALTAPGDQRQPRARHCALQRPLPQDPPPRFPRPAPTA